MPDHKPDLDEKVNHDRKERARAKGNQKALTQDHGQEVNQTETQNITTMGKTR